MIPYIQLEGGIESACKHSMISSHLSDYGQRGGINFSHINRP